MEINCDYHPDTIAVERCERSHRNICLNDKKVLIKNHNTSVGQNKNMDFKS